MNPGRREMSAVCWGHPGVGLAYREGGRGAAGAWDEDGGGRRAGACHTRGETSVCSLQAAGWVPTRDVHQQPHFWECNLSKERSRIQSFSKDKGPPDGAGEELSTERSAGSLQSWLGGSCSHTHLVGTEPAQRPSPDSTSVPALWGRAPACGSLSGRAVSWAPRLLSSIPGLHPPEARCASPPLKNRDNGSVPWLGERLDSSQLQEHGDAHNRKCRASPSRAPGPAGSRTREACAFS